MHKRIALSLTSLLILSAYSNVFAVAPGFYLGFGAGLARTNAPPQTFETTSGVPPTTVGRSKKKGAAVNLFLGNKFNNYFSVEGSYTFFTPVKYKTSVPTKAKPSTTTHTVDLLGKLSFSLWNLEIFGKGGFALFAYQTSPKVPHVKQKKRLKKFRPVIALGAGYDLSQNWVVDLTAQQTMLGGNQGSPRTLMINFSYHFVDKYCGQFLCGS